MHSANTIYGASLPRGVAPVFSPETLRHLQRRLTADTVLPEHSNRLLTHIICFAAELGKQHVIAERLVLQTATSEQFFLVIIGLAPDLVSVSSVLSSLSASEHACDMKFFCQITLHHLTAPEEALPAAHNSSHAAVPLVWVWQFVRILHFFSCCSYPNSLF